MPISNSRIKPPDDSLVSHTSELSDGTTNTDDRKRWTYQALRNQRTEKGRLDTYPFSVPSQIANGATSGIYVICSGPSPSGVGAALSATGMHAHARHDSRTDTDQRGVVA